MFLNQVLMCATSNRNFFEYRWVDLAIVIVALKKLLIQKNISWNNILSCSSLFCKILYNCGETRFLIVFLLDEHLPQRNLLHYILYGLYWYKRKTTNLITLTISRILKRLDVKFSQKSEDTFYNLNNEIRGFPLPIFSDTNLNNSISVSFENFSCMRSSTMSTTKFCLHHSQLSPSLPIIRLQLKL